MLNKYLTVDRTGTVTNLCSKKEEQSYLSCLILSTFVSLYILNSLRSFGRKKVKILGKYLLKGLRRLKRS